LGNPATRFILSIKTGIAKMRGKWAFYNDIPFMPTYHPSYVLRNGGEKSPLKKDVWSDIKLVLEYLKSGKLSGEVQEKINSEEFKNSIQINENVEKKDHEQKKLF
jgi:hypothetical protein